MISKLASVHPQAKIGKNTVINDFVVIGKDVKIGNNCTIKSYVYIQGPIVIGNNNIIHQFASLGDSPQDISFNGENTKLEIGNNNIFREHVSVHRGTKNGRFITKIGDNNFFMVNTHIAHDCIVGNYNTVANNSSLAGYATLANHIVLGGYTMVSQFVNIGSFVFTAMGSGVNKNIPPFMSIANNTIKIMGINKIGVRRNGFNNDEILKIKQIYKLFFNNNLKLTIAIKEIENITKNFPKLQLFNNFIQKYKNHKIGIIRK